MTHPCPIAARLALAWYAAVARVSPVYDGTRLAPDALATIAADAARPEVAAAREAYSEHRRSCAVCRARVAELAAIAGVSTDDESRRTAQWKSGKNT